MKSALLALLLLLTSPILTPAASVAPMPLLTNPHLRCGSVLAPQSAEFFSCRADLLLADLTALGLNGFGCNASGFFHSFASLRASIGTIEYDLQDLGPATETSIRWTAFYIPREKRVVLNSRQVIDPYVASALALHESLGALGIAEPRYQISILPALLYPNALPAAEAERAQPTILKLLRENSCPDLAMNFSSPPFANKIARGGSGDVVGSGGDSDSLMLKVRLARDLLSEGGPKSAERIIRAIQAANLILSDSTCDPCPLGQGSCHRCMSSLKISAESGIFSAYVSRSIMLDSLHAANAARNGFLYRRLKRSFQAWLQRNSLPGNSESLDYRKALAP